MSRRRVPRAKTQSASLSKLPKPTAVAEVEALREILAVISRSPSDAQPVFEAIVARAARLCDAEFSAVARLDGELLHLVAVNNMLPEEEAAHHSLFPRPPRRDFIMGRAFLDGRPVHIEDIEADPNYDPRTLAVLKGAASYRTYLGVPIVRDGVPIGAIGCGRREVKPFTPAQIELVKTFADQAVIAIENVRLFRALEARNADLTELLDQQTATGEILRVISCTRADVQPVFEAIAASSVRLCEAAFGTVNRYDGSLVSLAAHSNIPAAELEVMRTRVFPFRPDRTTASGRALLDRAPVHVHDVQADPDYAPAIHELARYRTVLTVPMVRDGTPIGTITLWRSEVRPFSEQQIALLQTFADQAVIAIQNVRLFIELEARNRDLTDALDRQTATAEILRTISQAQDDVQPVFDIIAGSAMRLFGAWSASVFRYDVEMIRLAATRGGRPGSHEAFVRALQAPRRPTADRPEGRALLTLAVQHVVDAETDAAWNPRFRDDAGSRGFRSLVAVPMRRAGEAIGVVAVSRERSGGFSATEIALIETFADQAVIAVENARLLRELQAKNANLTEALEQQTATAEILRVISSSPTDVQPVFDAIAASAMSLCGAPTA
jgi:two-component system NtrC family sensor kinase